MFRPLLGYYQVYCLFSSGELVFNTDLYFEYDYITYNIMLGNKTTLSIIYFLVQLSYTNITGLKSKMKHICTLCWSS
jgi:hypothetical protein